MHCIHCGPAGRLSIYRTESLGRDVKRRRKCRRCGRCSTTIEVELTDSVGFALEAVGKRHSPPRKRF